MVYPNQKIYKGGWKRNLYHGSGVITYPCGVVHSYNGEWNLHKKHGSGSLLFFNGDSYEGHFKDNMVNIFIFSKLHNFYFYAKSNILFA
jgi:hypothetical protein